MPLLPIALWHRLWFLNNEISKHIYVYMLLPKLSYCRKTSNSGPAETLMLFHSIRGWEPSQGESQGTATKTSGGSRHRTDRGAAPWPAPWPAATVTATQPSSSGQRVQKRLLVFFFPSHQAQSSTLGDITKQTSRCLLPYSRCFPRPFSFPDNSSNHNNVSTKQKQLGSGPMLCFHLLQEPQGLHLLPSWSVSGLVTCLGPINTVHLPEKSDKGDLILMPVITTMLAAFTKTLLHMCTGALLLYASHNDSVCSGYEQALCGLGKLRNLSVSIYSPAKWGCKEQQRPLISWKCVH